MHGGAVTSAPGRTRRGCRGRAAARPPGPATEPDTSGVARRGGLVQGEADHATPCASASSPPAPPPSAALATVTPPPAEEPPPPTATGVHGARDERGVSSEDETTSGPLGGMTGTECAALATLEASAWASGGSDGRGPRPRACSPPSSTTDDDVVARPTKLQALNDD